MLATMARPKAEKESDDESTTRQVTFRVSKTLLNQLETIANPFDLRQSELIRRAIEEYVIRHKQEQQAKNPRH